jgi:hypothetical protein
MRVVNSVAFFFVVWSYAAGPPPGVSREAGHDSLWAETGASEPCDAPAPVKKPVKVETDVGICPVR